MHRVPPVRGRGRVAAIINRQLLRLGAPPLCTVRMRRGHRLVLDTRVPSHLWAAYSGRYDEEEISELLQHLPAGGVALDVGANIGLYTIPVAVAAQATGGRVIAFEPHPRNRARLIENIRLNCLEAVVVVRPEGLSAERRRAVLTEREDFAAGGETGNAAIEIADGQDSRFSRVTIDLAPLDELWPELDCGRLDLIKVDIEGHEDSFLSGARATVARFRPAILTEVNRWFYRRRGVDFDRAIPSLLPSGYRAWYRGKPIELARAPELSNVLFKPV